MKITRRGQTVLVTIALIAAGVIGLTTGDWTYYELEGGHSVAELGR